MIVLIGMAVGVDYSLFYLKREREERAKGARHPRRRRDRGPDLRATRSSVSGGAVIASMAGLYVIGDATFNSLATGSILVVAVAVLGSITVLPALLAKLGRWVDRPRVPLLWRLNRRIGQGGISRRVLAPVVRHPVAALAGLRAVVVGARRAGARHEDPLGQPRHAAGRHPRGADLQGSAESFPAEGATARSSRPTAAADGGRGRARRAWRARSRRATSWPPGREPGRGLADGRTVGPDAGHAVRRVRRAGRPGRPAAARRPGAGRAGRPRGPSTPSAAARPSRSTSRPRAGPAAAGDRLRAAADDADDGVAFRSVPIALVSTVLNLASVGAAFGVMTLVFQHGWGEESLLDFTSPGFVIDWIPLFVLVVLVGLSMDYHVFVLSRVREHVQRGCPPAGRPARRHETAGVVTSAAAVMVSVFAIFATLSMLEMKMMGVGLSAAILLDATLVRLVMLPAALVLLGERAWWPRRRRQPQGEQVVETDPARWPGADEAPSAKGGTRCRSRGPRLRHRDRRRGRDHGRRVAPRPRAASGHDRLGQPRRPPHDRQLAAGARPGLPWRRRRAAGRGAPGVQRPGPASAGGAAERTCGPAYHAEIPRRRQSRAALAVEWLVETLQAATRPVVVVATGP